MIKAFLNPTQVNLINAYGNQYRSSFLPFLPSLLPNVGSIAAFTLAAKTLPPAA